MTAAELNTYATELTEATTHTQGITEQVRLRGITTIWEPAARRYRDLTDDEKEMNA